MYGFRARINGLCCLWALRVIFWVLTVACVSAKKKSSGRGLVLSMTPVPCHCLSSGSHRNKRRPCTVPLSFVQILQEEMETPVPCHCLLSGSHRNKGRPYTMPLSFLQILQEEMGHPPTPNHATIFCLDLTGIKGNPTPCQSLFVWIIQE